MRKWVKITIPSLLLTVGVVICALRWQAWFGMPAEPEWVGDTIQYVFSSPVTDPHDPVTIMVLGDIHNELNQADYDRLSTRVPQVDAIAQVGDWMDRGQNYYYQMLLREWTPSALEGTPVIVCPGNHEYTKGLRKTLSPVWRNAFPHPDNGPKNVPGEHYYLDFPQLRFIVLDTNPLTRLVWLTRTLTWLCEAMHTAGDRYIVVMMHHPVFSAAKGRFNSLIYATFRYTLGQADLVIAGHDHSYMRRTPFIILNTAGRPKEQRFRFFAPEVTSSEPVYGVIELQSPDINLQSQISHLKFTVHRLDDGSVIDSLYVAHP